MRYNIYIFILFAPLLWAQTPFEKANQEYRNNQFEQAVETYESILKTEKHSVELYYNLGNAYYKLDKIAPAIYNYEKALLLDPNNVDVINNLKFAQNRTVDDIKFVEKMNFLKLFHNLTSILNYNTWGWIANGCSVLFLIFFIKYYFTQSTWIKRSFFIGMVVAIILMIITVLTAFFEKNQLENEQPAIVYSEKVSIKNEPNQNALETFTLHEGTKVYILETLDQWNKIELKNGSQGWVVSEHIKKLK